MEEITKEKILELISKMNARELRLLLYFMKGMLAGKAAERQVAPVQQKSSTKKERPQEVWEPLFFY